MGEGAAGPPPTAGAAGGLRDAGLLGRETKSEVVLLSRLTSGLEKLNPTLPPEAITAAISVFHTVSPAGEMCDLTENRAQGAGHGSGHDLGHRTWKSFGSGLCST